MRGVKRVVEVDKGRGTERERERPAMSMWTELLREWGEGAERKINERKNKTIRTLYYTSKEDLKSLLLFFF